MKIDKQASTLGGGTPTKEQLEKVNLQSKTPMEAEDVYVFALRLCDDQVDRDGERFDGGALPVLGRLFLGKPGIVDHNWSAEKQVARIFDTQVQLENGVQWLKAWAYIPRMGHEQLIADIETGIRREISISCSMRRKQCSLCGEQVGSCGHRPGSCYDGGMCTGILMEPEDAYEFSFVAVPAQKEAGVVKQWKGGDEMKLKEYVEKSGIEVLKQELQKLKKLAAYGEAQRRKKEQEVARMGVALELGPGKQELLEMAELLEDTVLDKLYKGLSEKMEKFYDGKPQLSGDEGTNGEKEAYLI